MQHVQNLHDQVKWHSVTPSRVASPCQYSHRLLCLFYYTIIILSSALVLANLSCSAATSLSTSLPGTGSPREHINAYPSKNGENTRITPTYNQDNELLQSSKIPIHFFTLCILHIYRNTGIRIYEKPDSRIYFRPLQPALFRRPDANQLGHNHLYQLYCSQQIIFCSKRL